MNSNELNNGFRPRSLQLRDGQPCNVLEGGSGAPIVFVHGLPGLGSDLLSLAETLADSYRCFLLDRPGYGASAPTLPARCTSIEQGARDLEDVLETLGLTQACVVGWSYGGHLAAALAKRSNRVDRLVFMASAGPQFCWPVDVKDRLLYGTPFGPSLVKLLKRLTPRFLKRQLEDAMGCAAPAGIYQAFLKGLDRPGAIETWFNEAKQWHPTSMDAGGIEQPSLVIHGDLDTRIPIAIARNLNEQLRNSHLVVVPGAGHWPFLSHTSEVSGEMRQFLAP